MPTKSIWYNGKRFYYYGTYDDRNRMIKTAQHYQRKTNTKYHVIIRDKGYWFPYKVYDLYFNKIVKLF